MDLLENEEDFINPNSVQLFEYLEKFLHEKDSNDKNIEDKGNPHHNRDQVQKTNESNSKRFIEVERLLTQRPDNLSDEVDKGSEFNSSNKPADAYYQDDATGKSLLMLACSLGDLEICSLLLEHGAPWNALDRYGKCAGDYALDNGHQHIVDALVNHAVTSELLLGAIQKKELNDERDRRSALRTNTIEKQMEEIEVEESCMTTSSTSPSDESSESLEKGIMRKRKIVNSGNLEESHNYLSRGVRYDGDKLLDTEEDAVMMEWETPLMHAHADILCGDDEDRDVLNVGFGMGIIDTAIQQRGCRSHTIIEAHPDVYAKAIKEGWGDKPNVKLLFGRWQTVLPQLLRENENKAIFDAIFFDTYAEHFTDMEDFHELLPSLLRSGGIYSYFNGLAPDNIFFHGVACQVVKLKLDALNFETQFITLEIEVEDKVWQGVRRKYWHDRKEYYLPVAIFQGFQGGTEDKNSSTSHYVENTSGMEIEMENDDTNTNFVDGKELLLAALTHSPDYYEEEQTENENWTQQNQFDDAKADDILVAEVELSDGTFKEVLLRAQIDPSCGGLDWSPIMSLPGVLSTQNETSKVSSSSSLTVNENVSLNSQNIRENPLLLGRLRLWYRPMLNDSNRNHLYRLAIRKAITDFKLKHGQNCAPRCLDIGTGVGLLAIMAVEEGAECVIACESFEALLPVARSVINAHPNPEVRNKIHLVGKKSNDLLPSDYSDYLSKFCDTSSQVDEFKGFDILISELLDSHFLSEGILPTIRDAQNRLLSPHAISIPSTGRVYGRLIHSEHYASKLNKLDVYGTSAAPCNCSFISEGGDDSTSIPIAMRSNAIDDLEYLSDEHEILQIDFNNITKMDDLVQKIQDTTKLNGSERYFDIKKDGEIHGILLYWEVDLLPSKSNILKEYERPLTISTRPEDEGQGENMRHYQAHWFQTIIPVGKYIPRQGYTYPLQSRGDRVAFRSSYSDRQVFCSLVDASYISEKILLDKDDEEYVRTAREITKGYNNCYHHLISPDTILSLNDIDANRKYQTSLREILAYIHRQRELIEQDSSKSITILDVSDLASISKLILSLSVSDTDDQITKYSFNLVSLIENPKFASLMKLFLDNHNDKKTNDKKTNETNSSKSLSNNLTAFLWRGAKYSEEWKSEWGEVDLLTSDHYFHSFGEDRELWSLLNFWYLRTALHPVVSNKATVLPYQARWMGALITFLSVNNEDNDFQSFANNYAPLGVDSRDKNRSIDLSHFDHAMREAAWISEESGGPEEETSFPISIWQHPHKLLTMPTPLLYLDFNNPINFTEAQANELHPGVYRQSDRHIPVQSNGVAHAVMTWCETDLTANAIIDGGNCLSSYLSAGINTKDDYRDSPAVSKYGKQRLYWLNDGLGTKVTEEVDVLHAQAWLDVISGKVHSNFEVVRK